MDLLPKVQQNRSQEGLFGLPKRDFTTRARTRLSAVLVGGNGRTL
jgi:hypothetical protein